MTYATEHIVDILKTARESKGLSQRELSRKAGVPQGHISKIENGTVDLRLSSLVALTRVLDLELTLVPRKTVPAVQSLVRSSARSTFPDDEAARQAHRELARIQKIIAGLPETAARTKEVAQLQRSVRDLQNFRFARPETDVLRTVDKAVKAFRNDTENLEILRRAVSQLQSIRNTLAHTSINLPTMESRGTATTAYSLDEDDHG